MAELGYLPTLYTIPIYLQQDLPLYVCCMYVCGYVRGWVHANVRVGACVCKDGRSEVGTNECMLNTSCTHVNAKDVRYLLVAFSIKTHFYNMYFNENYNIRSPLHQFSIAHSEVRCFILNKKVP